MERNTKSHGYDTKTIERQINNVVESIVISSWPVALPRKVVLDIASRAARRVSADLVLKTDLAEFETKGPTSEAKGDPNA